MTRKSLPYPEKLSLARLPTPLEPLPRMGEKLGVELYIKRDDTTGIQLSGNKIRKLEFLLAEARAQGADTVLTCGGEQSNHGRATAMAAARLGMRSVLLLRTDDPEKPPMATGNIALDRLVGAEIVWISRPDYARRDEFLAQQAERVRSAGGSPYIIPEGGSNPLGSWGYVAAAEELVSDLARLPARSTTIVYAAGSGGTGAGLLLGSKLLDFAEKRLRVVGICVCDDREYFVTAIHRICSEFDERFQVGAGVERDEIEIIDRHVGLGYGKSQPAELETLRALARQEGILLDPVYTGKAFHGLTRELQRDPTVFGERVVFLHTGGMFRLFSDDPALAPLFEP